MFKVGDRVRIAHPPNGREIEWDWVPSMDSTIGLSGVIGEIDENGFCDVYFDSLDESWIYHSDSLELIAGKRPVIVPPEFRLFSIIETYQIKDESGIEKQIVNTWKAI